MEITLEGLYAIQNHYLKAYDNLFNADNRNKMIMQHKGTSAQWITVKNLLELL